MIRAGSSWCDLAKHADGRVEFVHLRGTTATIPEAPATRTVWTVVCELASNGAPRWSVEAGQPLLYLRAAAADDGRVCAIGQGHDDGQACVTIEGGAPFSLGSTHGVFPVLVRGLESGWACYVQSGPASYAWITIDANGTEVDRVMISMPPTSQGFLYVASDGTPITQDRGRGAIPGLALPSPALSDPRVWVGQSMSAPTLALFDSDTGALMPLNTPGGQPPHIVESGGTFYVCSYVEGGAWLSTHHRPFAAAQPPPDPKPEPEPEPLPEEKPVQLESKHSQLIQAFADQFGLPGFSKEEGQAWVAKLAGTMKARWPSEGWGTKRASPGRPLSNESVARPANGRLWGYDLIIGAGQQPGPNPTPNPTPVPGFTFPVGVEMPEDVALSLINFYLAGIRERDKIHGESDTVPSRGALMYLFAVFFRELSSWIIEKKRAPQGAEWWAVGDRIAAAAVKHYQDRQGTD
jgi:hypothetical protein